MSVHENNDSMLDMYLFEVTQLINQLEEQILLNEKANRFSALAIDEIFRIMHTLKGSSAMMRFENITSLSHSMEDLFYYIREENNGSVNHADLIDLLLDCVDFLKAEENKISQGEQPDGGIDHLIVRIRELLPDKGQTPDEVRLQPGFFISADQFKNENYSDGSFYYTAHIYFDNDISMENMHAYTIIHNLKKTQQKVYFHPPDIAENSSSAETIRQNGFFIHLQSDSSYDIIYDLLRNAIFVKSLELRQLQDAAEFEAVIAEQNKEKRTSGCKEQEEETGSREDVREVKAGSAQQSIISVNVHKLDKLMDLVGEMVIAEAMVIQNSDLAGLLLNNFTKAARQLSKITTEIQDMVMSIRMVPLTATFQRMHRIVRDMNKKLGKESELIIKGEETEVDKNIIEHITDPLMHLIRNAVDHGIELPEERVQAGKSSTGRITIEAKNAGSDVVIIIKDDGRGLDRDRILRRARENGLLNKQEEITDAELFGLILLPGFSTNDEVTEFSGRGVGLDVVTRNMELVGGTVLVDSIPGRGTAVTLKIPLTLAIIDGMNLKVGESYYTLPTTNIKEAFRQDPKNIVIDPNGNEMIMVRGQCFTLIKLYELFDIAGARTDYSDGIIIMVESGGSMLCIFADELLGQQQVVVKALPEYIQRSRKIRGISGCTLLGNGSISLILDAASLFV